MTPARRHILYALVSVAIAFACGRAPGATSWRAGVLLLPIASSLLVPFASSARAPGGVAAALGLALGGAAWGLTIGLPLQRALALLEVLGAFGLLVASVCACVRARGASPGAVLLAGGLVAFLLLGTAFWVDPLVVATRESSGLQGAIVTASVGANPLLTLSMHVSGFDLLHPPSSLYARSTLPDHLMAYPHPWQEALAFLLLAAAFGGLSRALRRPEV